MDRIQGLGRALASLSLAGIGRAVREPRMTVVRLTAPAPSSTVDAARFLFPDRAPTMIEECRIQFIGNDEFFRDLDRRFVEVRRRRTRIESWWELLYMIVRLEKPRLMLETGVFDGPSSAVILQALEDNGDGRLISIDLPAVATIDGSTQWMPETCLPAGLQPGWAIPERLRKRHRLVLEDSREALPRILQEESSVDVFFHDSLHTFDHMSFEFNLAWERLPAGGLLLSDDIFWSPAFHLFCRRKRIPYVHSGGFGAARKP